ncbi:thioredoxin domain-containing protein [Natrinema thermotolerans]|uniref:Thioredoxin domain-containing protein n=1 Tax=Natrinema thermotolerans TaxID=121872 RepID=A0AAF0PEG7_9EURY|nr:thioredoxin domain-containing protein [Natrinema thermotolerans]QCC60169.1 thiol reductase thioredoxin [Natrinema thermotolerans]QCC61081.1 thiol reductase thioredoxin [Natrinema thermotolerans]WMT07183.1 thioredoxin domain-containing protein [Natrinema thermotolerans]
MSESIDDERQRIRERKKQELRERLENGESLDAADAGEGVDTPDEPIAITGQGHLDEVVEEYDVVLVDCYADWCGPCQMLEPTIEALAAETDAAVAKVDVDAHQRIAQQLGARGVPTLVLYADGQPVERMVGAQDRGTLEGLIAQHA